MTTPTVNQHPLYFFHSQRIDGKLCYFANDESVSIKITETEFKAEAFRVHYSSKPRAYDADCASCFLNHAHSIGYHNQSLSKVKEARRRTPKRLSDVTHDELIQRHVFLNTGFDTFLVSAITQDFWVHCPKANGGFGRSFCCHEGTTVYVSD